MRVQEPRWTFLGKRNAVGQERAATRGEAKSQPFVSDGVVLADVDESERGEAVENDAPRHLHRFHALGSDALCPATEQSAQTGDAVVGTQVAGERLPGNPPPLAELLEGLERHFAQGADRACVARVGCDAQSFGIASGFVPRAAAAPGVEQQRAELAELKSAGRTGRARRRRVPEPNRA